ncbi:hypothetical protein H6F67_19225 [Microcoleus sp. FACHB-1515]|uniref:hypothetical protein n=1 Tax=Cyanophyceae TaxID=3028117 RepID=UPI001686A279|nr:hypothetical protein [Microcoleus sp. FACHB-1515]MBD2091982.1 hypothetical protein [Microcoleus sp. FACHB-1515]
MAELTTEQMLYLLYADSYSERGTVTKGTVKSHLPSEWQKQAQEICTALQTQELILQVDKEGKPTKREGRFSVTPQGKKALASSLAVTTYQFDSSKGQKVLNTLLACIKETSQDSPASKSQQEMSFAEFEQKFKQLYFEERKRQELRGVVAIHSKELCQKFMDATSISEEKLIQNFELLKSNGKIFSVIEKDNELIQWVE